MKIQLKSARVTLEGGERITIRPLVPKDAAGLLAFYRNLPEEDRQFLDDDVTRKEWVDRYLARVDYDTIVPLVADYQGVIEGHAFLLRSRFGWMKHVGQIRAAVARDFQRKGVGTALVRALMKIALDFGLEKMTVRMMDNQAGAKKAFQRLGFRVEGVLKGTVKDIHGRKRNLLLMANDVSHIWQSMDALVSDAPHSREMG